MLRTAQGTLEIVNPYLMERGGRRRPLATQILSDLVSAHLSWPHPSLPPRTLSGPPRPHSVPLWHLCTFSSTIPSIFLCLHFTWLILTLLLFIYLAVSHGILDLHNSMWDHYSCSMQTFSCGMWGGGILIHDQGLNLGPLHWEHRVIATGPPELNLNQTSV